jgi:hypothetical protein
MKKIGTISLLTLTLSGCVQNKNENHHIQQENVNFIIGNVTSIYDIKLSLGSIDLKSETFKEDWFSTLSYELTEDKRYIVGSAKAGSFIAITSTKANDAGGAALGTFTPCNKTLVFKLPNVLSNVYVTHVNYKWENVVIYPIYSDLIQKVKEDFNNKNMIQARYRQLNSDLYNDCETLHTDPTVMIRPI